jgi:DNA-binding beta-propeller fold protein YncE
MRESGLSRRDIGKTVCPWSFLFVLLLASCTQHVTRPVAPVQVDAAGAIAVEGAGNIFVASGTDVIRWDGDHRPRPLPRIGAIDAMVADENYLYCAGGGLIRRYQLGDGEPVPFTGPAPRVEHAAGLDVAGAVLYVADVAAGKIRMFDTTSGAAAGEFDVHAPQAVAVDPLGQIWVAHDRSVIQAFRADGYSGVTYGGLGEVSALTFGPGARLYAADAASGRVMVLDTGASPAQFVPVLSLGDDAGRLCAVVADNHGNLITLQRRAGAPAMRLAKYGADTKLIWEVNR